MNTNAEKKTEEAFEAELFDALKFYGYLFPENPREVEMVDQLATFDDKRAPSIDKVLLATNYDTNKEIFDEDYSVAAYSADADDPFSELPDEEADDQEK